MKKIIKLLLLAALAWPSWTATVAQEARPLRQAAANGKQLVPKAPTEALPQRQFSQSVNGSAAPVAATQECEEAVVSLDGQFSENSASVATANMVIPPANRAAIAPIETTEKVTRYRWTNKSKNISNNGSATNQYVPLNLNYLENATCHGQTIYPSSSFSGMTGKRIKSITFHANRALSVYSGTTNSMVTLSLGETTSSQYSSATFITGVKQVAKVAKILNGGTEVKFELTYPYTYNGGNLVVDVSGDGSGNAYASENVTWKGTTSSTYYSLYQYASNSIQGAKFSPYITVVYEEEETVQVDAPVSGNKEFFQGIEYTWPINVAEASRPAENKATLDAIATDPDQMIGLLYEVYTNPAVPGNWKRGYGEDGHAEPYDDVAYTGVGRIRHSGSDYTTGYTYSDNYGWAVPGDIVAKVGPLTTSSGNTVYYAHMDSTQYKPNQEGLTILLIEMRDDFTTDGLSAAISEARQKPGYTSYALLKARIGYAFKSVRVITESMRSGEGFDAGTLFKLDCDKMNKFFMVAKGRVRYPFNSNRIFADSTSFYPGMTFSRLPLYAYTDGNYHYQGNEANDPEGWFDYNCCDFLAHMFEQFSPYDLHSKETIKDVYQLLVDMNSYGVPHDCVSVPTAKANNTEYTGHYFRMYGENDDASDCQDVRDLMFFVPDYRMMHFNAKTTTVENSVYVADGSDGSTTTTSAYIPVYGYYYDAQNSFDQMIYPSSMLTGLAGKKIKSITFFPTSAIDFGGTNAGEITVTMGTTTSSNFNSASSYLSPSDYVQTTVTPTYGANELKITFDEPYTYTSGTNLLIDMIVTTAGSYSQTYWNGIDTGNDYQSINYYSSYYGIYGNNFLPTMKVTYEETITDGSNRDSGNSNGRVATSVKYLNYNPDHRPSMALYVIHQDEVTCPDSEKHDEYYKLTLTWDSNMDEFLPGKTQEYSLLQLVQDELGNDTYVPVYYTNANGKYTDASGNELSNQNDTTSWVPVTLVMDPSADKKTYTDVYVRRLSGSQQVTYAIQGRDTGHFLSLQISNQQSYIVPGTDPAEMALLGDVTYYSRYNPQTQRNCYSNRIILKSNPNSIKESYVTADSDNPTTINLLRSTSENDANPVTVATVKVTRIPSGDSNGRLLLTMANQAAKTDYPTGKSDNPVVNYAGYHPNVGGEGNCNWERSFYARDGFINLGALEIYDNFTEDVSEGKQPGQYFYKVEFETAVPFTGEDGEQTSSAYSNSYRIPVYKTDSRITPPLDIDQVLNDINHNPDYVLGDIEFGAEVQLSSKSEILRYDAYRWPTANSTEFYILDQVKGNDDEEDLPPTGIAGNQGDGYSVSMNRVGTDDYYMGSVAVSQTNPRDWANFVDCVPSKSEEATIYTYAPVVELLSKGIDAAGTDHREDYNTYGGPQQNTAVGKLDVEVVTVTDENGKVGIETSEVSWEQNGKEYCFYNMPVRLKVFDIPEGYEVYKVRAWRLIDSELLGERPASSGYPDRTSRLSDDYLFEELTYGDEKNGEFDADGMRAAKLSGYELGSRETGYYEERKATFGAVKLQETETMPYQIIVRVYFTKANADAAVQPAGGPRRALTLENLSADGKYYVAEKVISDEIKGTNIITGINGVKADLNREVMDVNYVNTMGQVSNRPWQGVNVVVTRYTDGTTKTTKAVY